MIEGPATNHYRPPTPVELLQPCPHRHVFQEARQHRFTAIRRCSNDHAIRLEAAQLTWGEICHDHNFSSDQRLRCIRLRDPRYDLPGFAAKIDLLLRDENLRLSMGQLGRKRVEEELSWEHARANLLLAYKTLNFSI